MFPTSPSRRFSAGPPSSIAQLSIAPQVVARTRFSPPTPLRGECLSVPEALELLASHLAEKQVDLVELCGPGDPLASAETTLAAAHQVRARHPQLPIALRTLGCGAARLAGEIAQAGISYVELLVDAVSAEIYEKIYAWIRPGLRTLPIREATELLVREQRHAVSALKFRDLKVVVVTTLYPGINIHHVPRIAASMRVLGADGLALVPYQPAPDAEVALDDGDQPSQRVDLEKMKIALPLVSPLLGKKGATEDLPSLPPPTSTRTRVAVASSKGSSVDLHLGQADTFLIYELGDGNQPRQVERRAAPPSGGGDGRWLKLSEVLGDCFAVVVAAAGQSPRRLLAQQHIRVVIADRPLIEIVCNLLINTDNIPQIP